MVLPQEGEFVPVAPLEHDAAVKDVEEAAAPEPEGVPPLQDRPGAILEEVLDDAHHLGGPEAVGEHLPQGRPAGHRILRDLMVDGIFGVQGGQGLGIRAVEGLDPGQDHFFGGHRRLTSSLGLVACP